MSWVTLLFCRHVGLCSKKHVFGMINRLQKAESKKPQLTRTLSRKQSLRETGIADSGEEDSSLGLKDQDLRVERIHIESMDIRFSTCSGLQL